MKSIKNLVIHVAIALASFSSFAQAPVAAITNLDVARYQGVWYQVALIPNKFQAMCVADTTATYSPLPSGRIQVLNRCRNSTGAMTEALGEARFLDSRRAGEAKLQVRFAPAWLSWLDSVWGNYWVMALDADYQWALVGEPSRQFLWLLSRSPKLDAALQERIFATAVAHGYNRAQIALSPITAP
jgi:apolipoprotein D and lipocalin family protein